MQRRDKSSRENVVCRLVLTERPLETGAFAGMLLAALLVMAASDVSGQTAAASAPPSAAGIERLEFAMDTSRPPTSQAARPVADAEPAPAGQDAEALAKKLSNPVAAMISVPLQFNWDEGYGPKGEGHRGLLNIQPVVPVSLSQDWNLIVRTIIPVVYQDDLFPGAGHQSGLGDITQTFFFSPNKPGPGGIIWGVGPVILWPAATDELLGGDKWGAGPSGLILKQQGPWTFGMLANHIWSFAGADDRPDINTTFLQPFVSYTTKDAWTFNLNTESTYDWIGNEWSVPINFNISKLLKIGKLPVQIGGGVRYWAASSEQGPEGWGLRMTITFLLPK